MKIILNALFVIFAGTGFAFGYILCMASGDLTSHDRQFFLIVAILSFIGAVLSGGFLLITEAINNQTEYLKDEDVVNEIGTP